jgi:transglutaminase-like putative cysteine protease
VGSLLAWFWIRYRPAEGWLPLFLYATAVACLVTAVVSAGWIPEIQVVTWSALLAFGLGLLAARRAAPWWFSGAIHLAYSLALTTFFLARFWPSRRAWAAGWAMAGDEMRQRWALFGDRVGGWFMAVFSGGASEETIVFAFGLALLTWFLVAYGAWAVFRRQRPLNGLTLMGLALAVNGYYGDAPLWPVFFFIGTAALLAAAMNFAGLEQEWRQREVDYSDEIRLDLLAYSGGIALLLLSLSFITPSINPGAISRFFLDRAAVRQAEETLERAFTGVEVSRQEGVGSGPGAGAGMAGGGTLPRAHLIGNPPELQEIVVFSATVSVATAAATHWRGISYDVYNGRGWTISQERRQQLPALRSVMAPATTAVATITADVVWQLLNIPERYSLGLPLLFDEEVTLFWRGVDDLTRAQGVQGVAAQYRVVSQVSVATPAELRAAQLTAVPPAILARYTALPDDLPARVDELATAVAGRQPTPYDQARALERFLRQYPYSLDVPLPPAGRDPVDYFLFELQTGYCDYYASAMVVLARSLGLPARLAVGYLAQPANDEGVQVVREINAHSWPEIYFAGYGWVEFEPTAAFPSGLAGAGPMSENAGALEVEATPLPIPVAVVSRPSPWWGLLLMLLILLGWGYWHRRRRAVAEVDGVLWAYGRLQTVAQKLGRPAAASQTPAEFQVALTADLARRRAALSHHLPITRRLLERLIWQPDDLNRLIEQLTTLFMQRRYSRQRSTLPATAPVIALTAWGRIRRRLWLLRWLRPLGVKRPEPPGVGEGGGDQ